ncbi:Protein of unknown function DUF3743 [Phytophthora cactorum]|nr:Protein of unknown function DUF3743 [Phytophthora cactorum]
MSDGITASRAEVMESTPSYQRFKPYHLHLKRLLSLFNLLAAVYELSRLLNTGLDRDTLAILMALIQKGVNRRRWLQS